VAEISNLKIQIREEERQIRRSFAGIGEKYCELHGDDPEPEMVEDIQKILDAKEHIEELKENIAKLDQSRVCPNCSSRMPDKGMFCPICGNRYPDPEPEEETVETEEAPAEEPAKAEEAPAEEPAKAEEVPAEEPEASVEEAPEEQVEAEQAEEPTAEE
jgi:hypothetical protein